jgi:uncharacterized protein
VFISVRDLELNKLAIREAFGPGWIEFFDKKLRQVEPVTVTGEAVLRSSLGEIRVHGHIEALVEFDCDRCLEPAQLPLRGDFDLVYEPADADWPEQDASLSETDAETGFYEGDGIELADVVREQILLWLPMQRVCRADCRGICPRCGANRNVAECRCRSESADPRWAALRGVQVKR